MIDLLQHCHDYSQQYYEELLSKAEQPLADELFQQAEQCMSNEEQRGYFEVLQRLKERSGAMRATFETQLKHHYQTFLSGQDEETNIDDKIDLSTLSLVDRDELEDGLAISVIVSKSNSRNPEHLWKLNRRLAVLRGGKNVTDENNPFGPAKVCNALQAAVNELDVTNNIRILIYKHLGRIFVNGFGDILETLNTLLIDKGVLPNLQFSLTGTPPPPAQGIQGEPPDQHTNVESAQSIAHQQDLYNTIKSLQSQSGPRTQTANGVSFAGIPTGGNNDADTFAAVDYALALSAIQQSRAFLSPGALLQPIETAKVEEKLFNQLLKQADQKGRHKIAQNHADTVDLVGLIFRYMLDDQNLHDAVKSLLSHLHTPYLKLALIDESFLNNYEHSARILLNQMAQVGSDWVKDSKDRRVLPTIKKNVETILRDFIDDTSLFGELLEEFIQFRDHLQKRAKMVEQRNKESQQGLERLELSRQQAQQEILQRLQQVDAPPAIQNVLLKPWADFLAFNLLRHGEGSLTWQSALKVVDGVAWSINPAEACDSKEDFHRRQSNLEQSVNEGLSTIGYDEQASKELIQSLKEAHKLVALDPALAEKAQSVTTTQVTETATVSEPSCVASEPAPAVRPPNVRPPNIEPPQKVVTSQTRPADVKPPNVVKYMTGEQVAEHDDRPLSVEETAMLATLKDIAFGTWFEFKRGTAAVRLKLAWFSRITSHYMFVDQSGVKQKVETQNDLARGLCAGEIHIVEPTDKSFMERAFEAVLERLRPKK